MNEAIKIPESVKRSKTPALPISGVGHCALSEVYLMDCVQGLRHYPDNYFDLAVVDPPYGIGQPKQSNLKGYKNRKSLNERLEKNTGKSRLNNGSGKLKNRILNKSNIDWDDSIPDKEYFDELFRVSKNQIIWGGNYFDLPPTRCFICWDKVQPWENFSQVEYAWTSFDMPSKLVRIDNRISGKIHPTEKPVDLYDWLFVKFAQKGLKIIDTHLGSGNSRIAADKNNMVFVGMEKDPIHFENHLNKWNKYKSQIRMF